MSKTFVIGDIHGAYKALKQCLELAEVDYNKDIVIQLGDVADQTLFKSYIQIKRVEINIKNYEVMEMAIW